MVTEGRIASASILDRDFSGLHRQGAWDYQVYYESECSFADLGHAITSRSGGPDGLDPCNDHTDLITMHIRACAHVGLESRSPFLDHRIVEFAFRLSGRMKIRAGGVTKWIFREVAREFLPADLVDRRDKMGMVSPLPIWLGRALPGGESATRRIVTATKDRDPARDAGG
jgi:hypothetical protein